MVIESDMPDEQIIQEVHWWIAHDDEAQALAAASQRLALSMFTMERYAEEFVRAARDFLDQERQRRRSTGHASWRAPVLDHENLARRAVLHASRADARGE